MVFWENRSSRYEASETDFEYMFCVLRIIDEYSVLDQYEVLCCEASEYVRCRNA